MDSGSLLVNEIFYSLQGESTHAGRPCVFVRLAGCDLRCNWCDTEYAFDEGRKMTVAEVVEQVEACRCPLVEITGGEPLVQEGGVYLLIAALLERGHELMLETSGAHDVSRVDPRVIKVMDLKCPGSGQCERNLWSNLEHLTARDEVKFVIADRADFEWAREVLGSRALAERVNAVLFSCASGRLAPARLTAWMLADRVPARFQLQLHKHIWPPNARGV
ncbi:MAG: radical SAM protein [Candidatus Binataceae bacterium]